MNESARKTAAKTNPAYADWLAKGKDSGFLPILADALQKDQRSGVTFDARIEHHSHLELGHRRGVEAVLFSLLDPLDSRPATSPEPILPTYAAPTR